MGTTEETKKSKDWRKQFLHDMMKSNETFKVPEDFEAAFLQITSEALSEKQQDVIKIYYAETQDYGVISERLGMPEAHCADLHQKALRALKQNEVWRDSLVYGLKVKELKDKVLEARATLKELELKTAIIHEVDKQNGYNASSEGNVLSRYDEAEQVDLKYLNLTDEETEALHKAGVYTAYQLLSSGCSILKKKASKTIYESIIYKVSKVYSIKIK